MAEVEYISGESWHKQSYSILFRFMHIQAEVQNHLIKIQSAFRDDLISKVDVFKRDTEEFYKDYATVCIVTLE